MMLLAFVLGLVLGGGVVALLWGLRESQREARHRAREAEIRQSENDGLDLLAEVAELRAEIDRLPTAAHALNAERRGL